MNTEVEGACSNRVHNINNEVMPFSYLINRQDRGIGNVIGNNVFLPLKNKKTTQVIKWSKAKEEGVTSFDKFMPVLNNKNKH